MPKEPDHIKDVKRLDKEVDLWRDTKLRYTAYSNEIGEAFRPLVPVKWVHASYLAAGAYVAVDTITKTRQAHKIATREQMTDHWSFVRRATLDCLIWQSLASVILPGATIHLIVRMAKGAVYRRFTSSTARMVLPTVIGLASIPWVVHPIDWSVEHFMQSIVRPRFFPSPKQHVKPVQSVEPADDSL